MKIKLKDLSLSVEHLAHSIETSDDLSYEDVAKIVEIYNINDDHLNSNINRLVNSPISDTTKSNIIHNILLDLNTRIYNSDLNKKIVQIRQLIKNCSLNIKFYKTFCSYSGINIEFLDLEKYVLTNNIIGSNIFNEEGLYKIFKSLCSIRNLLKSVNDSFINLDLFINISEYYRREVANKPMNSVTSLSVQEVMVFNNFSKNIDFVNSCVDDRLKSYNSMYKGDYLSCSVLCSNLQEYFSKETNKEVKLERVLHSNFYKDIVINIDATTRPFRSLARQVKKSMPLKLNQFLDYRALGYMFINSDYNIQKKIIEYCYLVRMINKLK